MAKQQSLSSSVQRLLIMRMAEDVLGCKWSLTILQLVRQGICRPGAMERSVEGLTAKVLNERLRKLTTYKILQRRAYPEIPPRVEYRFSSFGEKFIRILDELAALDREFRDETSSDSRNTNPVAVE